MGTAEGRALARVALAGNPSDGFGGAVLAAVVPGMEAVVRAADGAAAVAASGAGRPLVLAAYERLARWCVDTGAGAPTDGVALEASTTIPEAVGLAGSSALTVATIRALAARWTLDLDLVTVARLALEAEADLLGIAGGPQDRLAQAAERTVLMDFGGEAWSVEGVDPPHPVELFVVWSEAAAEPSQTVHGPLQARRGEPGVVTAMQQLADLARVGAAALAAGDLAGLGAAMDGSFEARASIVDLAPAHITLVEGARARGANANYAGSGGAIVGLPPPGGSDEAERWAVAEGFGFHRVTLWPEREGTAARRT